MNFGSPGYHLKFVQKSPCRDGSAHIFTYVYKFYSPVTRYLYILRAEYHLENVFVIKFYVKAHRKSDYKYCKVTNRGDLPNIFVTCLKVIPVLLKEFPDASFGIIGAPSTDDRNIRIESQANNQRFRIYSQVAAEQIGSETFTHMKYPDVSGYLLVNNRCSDVDAKETAIRRMFASTYRDISF